ncbi:MAG: hypothetical protein L6R42_003141 [Xanthoria sp. 1 TBL-2021]|nr:MAG: hypothetical protein L6R42_003141 [Xanthoria sp. 1 TBL-2021]
MDHVSRHHRIGHSLSVARPDFRLYEYLLSRRVINDAIYWNVRANADDSSRHVSAYPTPPVSAPSSMDNPASTNKPKPKPYACLHPGCSCRFARSSDLDQHTRSHVPVFLNKLDCPSGFCGRIGDRGFTRQDHLNEHLRKVHLADLPFSRRRQKDDEHAVEAASENLIQRVSTSGEVMAPVKDPVDGLDANQPSEPTRAGDQDGELVSTAIIIKNIPFAVKKEQLVDLLIQLNLPLPYTFNYHFAKGVFCGMASAKFTSADETATVIYALNHFELQGRKLRVEHEKMLPPQEREQIEREKRERRGQLEEQVLTGRLKPPENLHEVASNLTSSLGSSALNAHGSIPSAALPSLACSPALAEDVCTLDAQQLATSNLPAESRGVLDSPEKEQTTAEPLAAGDRKGSGPGPAIGENTRDIREDKLEAICHGSVAAPEGLHQNFVHAFQERYLLPSTTDDYESNAEISKSEAEMQHNKETMQSMAPERPSATIPLPSASWERTECPECDMVFTGTSRNRRSNMKRHMEHNHEQQGKLKCPRENCNKRYPRSDDLLAHLHVDHRDSELELKYVYPEHETGLATAEDTESISATSTSGVSNATSRASSRASSVSTVPDGLPARLASLSSDPDPVSEDRPEIGEENVTQQNPHLEWGKRYPQVQNPVLREINLSVLSPRPYMTRMSLFSNSKQFLARLGDFGLGYLFSVLVDAIETEAPLSATKTRIRWTCACGRSMYDDFVELRPGVAEELRLALHAPSQQRPSGQLSTSSNHSQLVQPSGTDATANSTSQTAGIPVPINTAPYNPRPMNGRPAATTITCGPESKWLLVCAQAWQRPISLLHLNVCSMTSDQELFTELRQLYMSLKKAWWSRLSMKVVRSIRYVQFELHPKDLVDVRKVPDMPPESRKEEYVYQSCDLIPPIGENLMTHLFHHPHEANEKAITFIRSPKKRKQRLAVCAQMGTSLGWGIHLVEGWAWTRILLLSLALLLLGSLVFAISWSVLKHDLQGAFGVAAYLVALVALSIGTVQAYINQS